VLGGGEEVGGELVEVRASRCVTLVGKSIQKSKLFIFLLFIFAR
jgi:hypothetical protein